MSYSSRDLARWVWRDYFSKEKLRLGAALVLMAIEGSMLGALSYMLKPMFDAVLIGGQASALVWVGLAVMGIFALRGISSILQKVLLARASEGAGAAMISDLLHHVLRLDGAFHQTHPPGMLIERVQGDVNIVKGYAGAIITGVGRDIVALLSLLVVTILVDPVWTVIAFIGVPLMIAPSIAVQRYTRSRARHAREVASRMTTRLDEIFHGINPIKLNGIERAQAGRYDALQKNRIRVEVQARLGEALVPGLIDLMAGFGFIAVLYFGGRDIISGEKTVGEFMSFFTAMILMFEPVRRLGALSGLFQVAAAGVERLRALFDLEPTIFSPPEPVPMPAARDIVFDDVHLAYADQPVLRGLSFTASAGHTTALVGASGAGKSTVFNVLTRLVEPQRGTVTLGGERLDALDLAQLRSQFSVVTQDALLFDESLRDNMLLGAEGVPDEAIESAVRAANVTEFLPKLAQGLDSPAGPRGSALSGGQRQRVAIARALLRDAPILLLDEATSSLDARSEAAVQKALDELSRNRTTLVIDHRLSTIQEADKIVVMDRGAVVDEGTHDELLARDGLYAGLYRLQFREAR